MPVNRRSETGGSPLFQFGVPRASVVLQIRCNDFSNAGERREVNQTSRRSDMLCKRKKT